MVINAVRTGCIGEDKNPELKIFSLAGKGVCKDGKPPCVFCKKKASRPLRKIAVALPVQMHVRQIAPGVLDVRNVFFVSKARAADFSEKTAHLFSALPAWGKDGEFVKQHG